MAKRKLTKTEKIILIATINMTVILLGFWILDKQPNRDFFLPEGFSGWVEIQYNYPDQKDFPFEEGIQQIHISEDGTAQTSATLKVGWRRDRFFWKTKDGVKEIPSSVEKDGDYFMYIHQHKYYARKHDDLLSKLPVGTDTTLWDGTEIVKEAGNSVQYTPGQKTLEYFFVSKEPESITFNPPAIPDSKALESTEDREIPIQ